MMPTTERVQPAGPRRILLADADAFYVAVARLADPDGAGQEPLLIVGGSSKRGVVTSASYATRKYGVRSAMPTGQALRLCPKAVVVPVPRDMLSQKSREIRAALQDFSPVVEPASIDEFYVDLTGTERLYTESLADTAARIRQRVREKTKLAVSIGGGTSRLIAKLAAEEAKRRSDREILGVYIVPPGKEAAFVSGLNLADIPMIGPKFQERLAKYGLHTVRDALPYNIDVLQGWFGKRTARWLYNRIRGIDSGLVDGHVRSKSISHEETFLEDLSKDEDLNRELLRLAVHVAADMRRQGFLTRTVTVKLRDSDFKTRQAGHTFPEPVSADRPIVETAQQLLKRLRRARRTSARLLGVAVSQLVKERDLSQLTLFEESSEGDLETDHDRAVAKLVDTINVKFGRRGIRRGSEVRKKSD
jgi:DNA polymerase-4